MDICHLVEASSTDNRITAFMSTVLNDNHFALVLNSVIVINIIKVIG
jgi:hypothetical protein